MATDTLSNRARTESLLSVYILRAGIALWTLYCAWSFMFLLKSNPPIPATFVMTMNQWQFYLLLFRLGEWALVALPIIAVYNYLAARRGIGKGAACITS